MGLACSVIMVDLVHYFNRSLIYTYRIAYGCIVQDLPHILIQDKNFEFHPIIVYIMKNMLAEF
jgi:hypothetical protein